MEVRREPKLALQIASASNHDFSCENAFIYVHKTYLQPFIMNDLSDDWHHGPKLRTNPSNNKLSDHRLSIHQDNQDNHLYHHSVSLVLDQNWLCKQKIVEGYIQHQQTSYDLKQKNNMTEEHINQPLSI